MNNLINLPNKDKIDIFNTVATLKHISKEAAEKDWWVTAVLRSLFALPYSDSISFKGGTSLSKCWNVIERFSEDVDIAINREYFGFLGETLTKREVNKKLRKALCSFCRKTLQFDLEKQLIADGIPEKLFSITMDITTVTTVDPEKIYINYQSLFENEQILTEDGYIKPTVILEISGRSMKEPLKIVEIRSLTDETFTERPFVDRSFQVAAVIPERTFLEKIFLLHEEFAKKDKNTIRIDRMSRHLYNIVRMLETPIEEKALNDIELYKHIVTHRQVFIGLADFDYNTLLPKTINIIPLESILAEWKADYNKMRTMIYGDAPDFEIMLGKIKKLNEKINNIKLPN